METISSERVRKEEAKIMATRVNDQIAWVAGLVGIATTVAVQRSAIQEANAHSKLKQDGLTTPAIR